MFMEGEATGRKEKGKPEDPESSSQSSNRLTSTTTNNKLDAMLNKISQTLAVMKKGKHKTLEEQRSTRSDMRSELSGPTHKSAPSAGGRSSDASSRQRLDIMKQVELGLIYDRGASIPQLEEKEYFQDFMSLLVDDRDACQQRVAAGRHTATNSAYDQQPSVYRSSKNTQEPSLQILKQRVSDTINKAELAIKNYRQIRPVGRMKNSHYGSDQ